MLCRNSWNPKSNWLYHSTWVDVELKLNLMVENIAILLHHFSSFEEVFPAAHWCSVNHFIWRKTSLLAPSNSASWFCVSYDQPGRASYQWHLKDLPTIYASALYQKIGSNITKLCKHVLWIPPDAGTFAEAVLHGDWKLLFLKVLVYEHCRQDKISIPHFISIV